jgi:V8-like Glu-specific endopeptidase
VVFPFFSNADIYGKDERRQVYLEDNKKGVGGAVAVAVLNSLWADKNGETFSLEYIDDSIEGLCKNERFSKDPSVPYACTGFLIGEDLLVTAGHCSVNVGEVSNSSDKYCEAYIWLFDYQFSRSGRINLNKISKENIFNCKEILYAVHDGERDFSLIRLDRPVKDRVWFELAKRDLSVGEPVDAYGFPAGLPMKKAPGRVLSKSDHLYMINSDAMSGNSGSPVLNRKNEVIGVLIGGRPNELFYTDTQNRCQRFNRCDNRGQNCTKGNEENMSFPFTGIQVFRFNEQFNLEEIVSSSVSSKQIIY